MILEPLIGPYGDIPLVIRDDDTNYFTKPNMLDGIYDLAWKKGYKTSLSVIPCQKGIDDLTVPPNMRNTGQMYQVTDNTQLVSFLKEKVREGVVEILQHGFSHDYSNGRGEFSDKESGDKISKGNRILQDTFNQSIRFFVPPNEDISPANLRFLSRIKLVALSRQTTFDTLWRSRKIPHFVKNLALKAAMFRYDRLAEDFSPSYMKPVMLNVADERIEWSLPSSMLASLNSFDSIRDLALTVREIAEHNRKPICILNHYHPYYFDWQRTITRRELHSTWNKILDIFEASHFWKTTFAGLYERSLKVKQIRMEKTGNKITISSGYEIEGVSFRLEGRLEPCRDLVVDRATNIVTIERLTPLSKIVAYAD